MYHIVQFCFIVVVLLLLLWFALISLSLFLVTYTLFTRYNRLSNQLYNPFDNRLYRVNKHPTSCQTVWQPVECSYTRYSRLSNRLSNGFDNCIERTALRSTGCQTALYNGFDNRVERTAVRSTGCQTVLYNHLTTVLNKQPLFVQQWLFVQPVVKPGCTTGLTTGCIHHTAICQTGLTTGWMFVYTIQLVWQPVWQQVVSCIWGFIDLWS